MMKFKETLKLVGQNMNEFKTQMTLAFVFALTGVAMSFHAAKAATDINDIIASGTQAVDNAGGVYATSWFALWPVWLKWAIPIAIIGGVIAYFLRKGHGSHR